LSLSRSLNGTLSSSPISTDSHPLPSGFYVV
jgi:hypothetical protein